MKRWAFGAGGLCMGALAVSPAAAIHIELDFTHDTFFTGNATAQNALQAAASDISAAITTVLNGTSDTSSGTFGGTTQTYDFYLQYANPTFGGTVYIDNAALPANEVRVFVGHRNLNNTTLPQGGSNVLAQGGPGGLGGFQGGANSITNIQQAVNAADVNATANLTRGGGPIMGTFDGVLEYDIPGVPNPNFSMQFGSLLGNLWFDSDANNDNIQDAGILDSDFWHFDHTAPVAAGKFDLYSVALHEILHAIGIGSAESWEALVSGTTWTGAEVVDLWGTGAGLVDGGGGHIASGLQSRDIYSLTTQEVVMSPSIGAGERRFLTELDLAFLRDIGWETVVVPEPAAASLMGVALLGLIARRRAA